MLKEDEDKEYSMIKVKTYYAEFGFKNEKKQETEEKERG